MNRFIMFAAGLSAAVIFSAQADAQDRIPSRGFGQSSDVQAEVEIRPEGNSFTARSRVDVDDAGWTWTSNQTGGHYVDFAHADAWGGDKRGGMATSSGFAFRGKQGSYQAARTFTKQQGPNGQWTWTFSRSHSGRSGAGSAVHTYTFKGFQSPWNIRRNSGY